MNKILQIFTILIFAGGCAQAEEKSLMQKQCEKLSEQEGVPYEALSGEVLSTSVLPPRWLDCFRTPGGCWGGKATFVARLKSPNKNFNESDGVFFIHTKLEPAPELYKKKPPYMKKGESYRFCAAKTEKANFINAPKYAEHPKYRIDFVDTINHIEQENTQ